MVKLIDKVIKKCKMWENNKIMIYFKKVTKNLNKYIEDKNIKKLEINWNVLQI